MRQTADIKTSTRVVDDETVSLSAFKKLYYMQQHAMFVPSLEITGLSNFKQFLLSNSETIQLTTDYFQRPDLFCLDKYGTMDYYFILLYINSMFSFADFSTNTIKMPSKEAVEEIVNEMQRQTKKIETVEKTLII